MRITTVILLICCRQGLYRGKYIYGKTPLVSSAKRFRKSTGPYYL